MILLLLVLACADKPTDDSDCNPSIWPLDLDGDSFAGTSTMQSCERPAQAAEQGGDCDDADPSVHLDAEEVCNGKDDDCDGVVDPPTLTWYMDEDADGFGNPARPVEACAIPEGAADNDQDCDDTSGDVYPGAVEIWYDGVDQDCRGDDDYDADQDGHAVPEGGGEDCDDSNPLVHPGVEEICYNDQDDNCNGSVDECGLSGEIPMTDANWRIEGDGDYQYLGWEVKMIGEASAYTERPLFAITQADYRRNTGVGYVYLYSLEEGGPVEQARFVSDESHFIFGTKIQDPADFNGDGYLDITIWADESGGWTDLNGPGHSLTYFGPFGREIDADDFDVGWWGSGWMDHGGRQVVGPLQGEGMDGRVAVSIPAKSFGTDEGANGAVYLHDSTQRGVVTIDEADDYIYGTDAYNYAGSTLKSTDVDGDGVSDLILNVGQQSAVDTRSMVVTFLGPIEGAHTIWDNDGEVVADAWNNLGWEMDLPGDMNGDGVDEIVLGAPYHQVGSYSGAGAVWVLSTGSLVGTSRPDDDAICRIEGRESSISDFVGSSLSHGDFNGDGNVDLLLGAEEAAVLDGSEGRGIAYGYYSLPGGVVPAESADFQLQSTAPLGLAAFALAANMDLNEDGFDDIVISEPNWPEKGDSYGVVGIFLGEGW